MLDGLTSAVADILFLYSVLQIIVPYCGRMSVIGTVYGDKHDNANENNGTLDYVRYGIYVENIVHTPFFQLSKQLVPF